MRGGIQESECLESVYIPSHTHTYEHTYRGYGKNGHEYGFSFTSSFFFPYISRFLKATRGLSPLTYQSGSLYTWGGEGCLGFPLPSFLPPPSGLFVPLRFFPFPFHVLDSFLPQSLGCFFCESFYLCPAHDGKTWMYIRANNFTISSVTNMKSKREKWRYVRCVSYIWHCVRLIFWVGCASPSCSWQMERTLTRHARLSTIDWLSHARLDLYYTSWHYD